MAERTEGWGYVLNARNAHYFRDNMSLCRRWMAYGGPVYSEKQPTRERTGGPLMLGQNRCCVACAHKAPANPERT
jgi:hypothetical protein